MFYKGTAVCIGLMASCSFHRVPNVRRLDSPCHTHSDLTPLFDLPTFTEGRKRGQPSPSLTSPLDLSAHHVCDPFL
ncbi:hypothetical protein E2C01_074722 [Portunus trituberculatus]|uniref:Uncharacterized protein n=1 Tax=Portunus trituberculatus TaxID=210409 RepID=A0A5B7ID07_PORTR|nr:hypothetical protein [Portunus trituberculatus]